MLEATPLEQLLEHAQAELARLGYRTSSLQIFQCEWGKLKKFAAENGIQEYSSELAENYLVFRCGRNVLNVHSDLSELEKNARRTVLALDNCYTFGIIQRSQHGRNYVCPENFKKEAQSYLDYQKTRTTPESMKNYRRHLYQFIGFLYGNGISSCAEINGANISSYCATLAGYDACTIYTRLCSLRSFLRFLYEYEYISQNMVAYVPKVKLSKDSHIPTTWTDDEVKRIIACIDRGNPVGKRDYAIILMAATLGMRIGDIRDLRLSSLNWNENRLEFQESKNGQAQVLPLSNPVGWALIEYLKNGRPQTDSPFVFVQQIPPYNHFSTHNSFWYIIGKYLKMAHIPPKKRGCMHSFRHTLASNLLRQGNTLPLISNILGHADPKSSKAYLKIDVEQLRNCCLAYGKGESSNE